MKLGVSLSGCAQAALMLAAVAIIVFNFRLTDRVTTRAIGQPTGDFTSPYEAHGTTVYISPTEKAEMNWSWGLPLAWCLGSSV